MKIIINKIISLIIINSYNFYSHKIKSILTFPSQHIIKKKNPNIEKNFIRENKILTVDKKERTKTTMKFYHRYPKISEFIFIVGIVILIALIIHIVGIIIFGSNYDEKTFKNHLNISEKYNHIDIYAWVTYKEKKDKTLERNILIIITLLLIIFLLIEHFFIKPKIFYKHYDKKLIFWADKYLNLIFIFIMACGSIYFAYCLNETIQKIIIEPEKTLV